jgi:hypothetical protein
VGGDGEEGWEEEEVVGRSLDLDLDILWVHLFLTAPREVVFFILEFLVRYMVTVILLDFNTREAS